MGRLTGVRSLLCSEAQLPRHFAIAAALCQGPRPRHREGVLPLALWSGESLRGGKKVWEKRIWWWGQGGFLVRSLVDGAGSYSVAHRAGLLPTELTGMWGWILLRSPHRGRGSPPAPAPTKQRPEQGRRR